MAIFHLHLQIITRGKGKSAVAAAAYRSGETIKNEYDGVTHDYTRKGGIVHTEILLPGHAPAEHSDRAVLWNAVEKAERYENAQLSRDVEVALPAELTTEQNISLVRRYVSEVFVQKGMCADICLHDKGDGNPHAHIMLTMRPIENDGTWGAKLRTVNGKKSYTTDWNDRNKAEEWRKAWAAYANGALRMAGLLTGDNMLDYRSYERRGIDKVPTVHLGAAVTQMERRGIRTERGDMNRAIEVTNKELSQLKARIRKLQKWLDEEKKSAPAALSDVLSEMLNGDPERGRWQQIRDLQMAAKTLVFIQNNNLRNIEDIRGTVAGLLDERQVLSKRLSDINRRMDTLDKHLIHSENLAKYRKVAARRDALYAEYKQLDSQGFLFKGKARKAFDAAEAYDWKHLNELRDYDEAEKYLRGVLQKRYDPKKIPVAKWKQERDALGVEMGGINTEFTLLKDRIRDVEQIRKYAERVQSAINQPLKKRARELVV